MKNWAKENARPIAAIAALVVINIVLVSALLIRPASRMTAGPAPASTRGSDVDSRTPDLGGSPHSPDPSPSPRSKSPEASSVERPRRILAIGRGLEGWRATTGDCETDGKVEMTRDAGQTWETVEGPSLSPISSLEASSGGETLAAIGGSKECTASYAVSYSDGAEWVRRDANLKKSWYRIPDHRTEVNRPGGKRSKPCPSAVAGLAAADNDNAVVLCSNEMLKSTDDGGRSWAEVGTIQGGVALGGDSDGYVTASVRQSCDGVIVTHFEAEMPERASQSREICAPTSKTESREIAITRSADKVWVWRADKVAVSTDGGESW